MTKTDVFKQLDEATLEILESAVDGHRDSCIDSKRELDDDELAETDAYIDEVSEVWNAIKAALDSKIGD